MINKKKYYALFLPDRVVKELKIKIFLNSQKKLW